MKKSEFAVAIDYMRAVEMTGKMGGFELAVMYWEKVVQPFLEKSLKNPGPQSSEEELDTQNKSEDKNKAKIQEEIESIPVGEGSLVDRNELLRQILASKKTD